MIQLFGHPFSSYTWKALIALWENDTPFAFRRVDDACPDNEANAAELTRHWPLAKFPLLLDGGRPVMEATAIIEHLAVHHPGPVPLIPADPAAAVATRMLDRIFDNHVMTPVQAIVAEHLPHLVPRSDATRVGRAHAALDTIYAWLDGHMGGREWAAADAFTLADCAAGPALFYADWVRPIPHDHLALRAYRARLLARPSIARAIEGARPFRHLFPLGAPDRD